MTRSKTLVYASSDANSCNVYVFALPHGKLVQTLNACDFGFGPGFGLCNDTSGDVFMAMGEGFSIFKFAHGGSEPIAQLENDSLLPVGCSVDPKNGDLGVASATGNVAVFKNASGTPKIYSLSDIEEFFFCTFDDRGNLFIDGEHEDQSFALAELPKGGTALREITVPGDFTSGFGIQWDGRHVALLQTEASNGFTIDRIRVAGSVAKVVGSTTLDARPNAAIPFEFWIYDKTIVQPEDGNTTVGFWKYPQGGALTKALQTSGSNLAGVTVSVAPGR